MYLPSLQPVCNSDIYLSGDVNIHPCAALGSGAILQAAPNSRIVIGAGACIGMGVIVQACQGVIEIESGAILGAGVLMIGQGKVGGNACVGAATTIYNASIDPMAIVPAGSLIGDPSRQVATPSEAQGVPISSEEPATDLEFSPPEPELNTRSPSTGDTKAPAPDMEEVEVELIDEDREAEPVSKQETQPENAPVIGQMYVNQLLLTLFPKGQSLNRPNQDRQ